MPHRSIDPGALGLTKWRHCGNGEVITSCPHHEDRHPSLSVNLTKGVYYCFSCGASGSASSLAKLMGGWVKTVPYRPEAAIIKDDSWRMLLRNRPAGPGYLRKRGLTKEQARRHEWVENSTAVILPFKSEEYTAGCLIRHKTSKFPKYMLFGERPSLWGTSEVSEMKHAVVTEGVFGALAAERAGIKAVATLSANFPIVTLRHLRTIPRLSVVMDDDRAGRVAAALILAKHPMARAVRGIEADRLSVDDWHDLRRHGDWTRDPTVMLDDDREERARFAGRLNRMK